MALPTADRDRLKQRASERVRRRVRVRDSKEEVANVATAYLNLQA